MASEEEDFRLHGIAGGVQALDVSMESLPLAATLVHCEVLIVVLGNDPEV